MVVRTLIMRIARKGQKSDIRFSTGQFPGVKIVYYCQRNQVSIREGNTHVTSALELEMAAEAVGATTVNGMV
jgi:hypothetical protein